MRLQTVEWQGFRVICGVYPGGKHLLNTSASSATPQTKSTEIPDLCFRTPALPITGFFILKKDYTQDPAYLLAARAGEESGPIIRQPPFDIKNDLVWNHRREDITAIGSFAELVIGVMSGFITNPTPQYLV